MLTRRARGPPRLREASKTGAGALLSERDRSKRVRPKRRRDRGAAQP